MKASELLEESQAQIKDYGDLEIELSDGSDPGVSYFDEDDPDEPIFVVE